MKRICLIVLLTIFIPATLFAEGSDTDRINSVGLGYGIQYGIAGLNVDLHLVQNLYVSMGLGTIMVSEDFAYNLGFKYYFLSPDSAIRPRVSLFFGSNDIVEVDIMARGEDGEWGTADDFVDESEWRRYPGWTIGAGLQWMLGESKRHGLDLDVYYIAWSTLDVDEMETKDHEFTDEPADVGFAIGYRFAL
ncbi:hypothetical protein ACFL27_02625 [candidate division CSSED10-310 bacterium]|uniref:Outer membrane protein beta-barrel domain-containing protein n=1 Tax=candidate division CSSED10-310 bacterium TaxID=2855610 RepID=A0ABV6YSA8_UNCC1